MSKQLLIANVNQIGSKGTVEKYTNENTIFESTPKLTIVDIGQTSEVTLQGTFIATAFHARSDRRLKENIADLTERARREGNEELLDNLQKL